MPFDRDFEHRDALLAAAIGEFVERGYDDASINRILTAAGMSKGQFYHHFEGKEALYMGVIAHLIARKRAHFEAHPLPTDGDFFQTLRAQIRAGVAFSRANPDVERFSRSFLRERGRPIFRRALERFAFDEGSAVARLVTRAHAAGAFAAGIPVEFAQQAVGMVLRSAPELLDADEPAEVEGRLDQLLRFLRGGLGR